MKTNIRSLSFLANRVTSRSATTGVGKVTALKLHQLGMHTCGDLQAYSIEQLVTTFGKSRSNLYFLSRGIDHRAVQPVRLPKSVSVQETYAQDLMVPEEYAKAVQALHTRLLVRLQKHTYPIRGIFIKLRFSDFTHVAKEIKISNIDLSHWYVLLQGMLPKPVLPIRSIAMGVRLLHQSTTQFHNLFPELV